MSTEASAPPVTRLDLKAALTGVLVPIEQVPDPVFAQKTVGEGDLDRPPERSSAGPL
jgi:phosphotransferase system IIA component